MRRCQGLSELAGSYSVFILDLWGVVHDGQALYPGALTALEKLHKNGKHVVFLSNAPRRSIKAEAVLTKLGIPREWYIAALTSGEVTYDYVRNHFTSNEPRATSHYYYIGPEKDADILSGLPLSATKKAQEASFAIVTGFDGDDSTLEEKMPDVEACLIAGIPLLCANPDRVVVRQNGQRMFCAGIIAEEYERRGGKVLYFGKPYPEIYKKCLSLFLTPDSRLPTLAIGDALHTDIAGARSAGIFSVLVTGGILQEELGVPHGQLPEQRTLEAICARENVSPDAVLPCFRW